MVRNKESYFHRKIIVSLMEKGQYTLNWGEDRICNEVNCKSYNEARKVAQACMQFNCYAYVDMRFERPYLIHITTERKSSRNWLELN
jgi:hypothetical protein